MSFLSSLNLGGGSSKSSSFMPESSSAFGNIFGNVASSVTKKGFDSGDAANVALDAAASVIPFGAMAKKFLDGLGLQENVDNVMKYGLSSWGASTSPEKKQGQFAQNFFPYLESRYKELESGANIQELANDLERYFEINRAYYINLRDNHSRAKSSRKANEWALKTVTEYRNQFRKQILALNNQGFKITSSIKTIEVGNYYPSADGGKDSLSYNNLKVHEVKVKQYVFTLNKKVSYNEETGKIEPKKSGLGSLIGIGAIGYAAKEFLPQILKAIK